MSMPTLWATHWMVKRSRLWNMIGPVALLLDLDGRGLAPENAGQTPIFARIAELITDEVRRGRLRPGARLPGTRPLAEQLGVGRNTVVAAYAELAAEGWIETRPAGGSFVSSEVPERRARRFGKRSSNGASAQSPGFDFEPRTLDRTYDARPGTFELFGGTPDLRLFPTGLLARAYRRALHGIGRANLDYTGPFGHARLRAALAGLVSDTRALSVSAEQLIVAHGSQMAIDLVARTLIRTGDRVAVEEIGYQSAWAALRNAGAKLVYLPVDKQGLDVAALEAELSRGPLRALYLTPHHQYPTTAALSVGRRLRLLELAAKHRMAVIEDDYDHEFHYDGRPLASLAGADRAGVVVYIGTLAKVLAPGLRLGFIAAPRSLIETIGAVRFHVDRHGDTVTECAVAELIEEGELARHARRMRRAYHARRDALVESLQKHFDGTLSFDVPAGGMTLWAEANTDVDTQGWLTRSARHNVVFTLGSSYVARALNARKARHYAQCLRLGFAQYTEKELETAVKRMASALRA
jgi:GntR family transcriptional regulator / MocR family aminotransferase